MKISDYAVVFSIIDYKDDAIFQAVREELVYILLSDLMRFADDATGYFGYLTIEGEKSGFVCEGCGTWDKERRHDEEGMKQ